MEFVRAQRGAVGNNGGPAPYSVRNEDEDGYDLEQTALAAYKTLESIESQNQGMRWRRQFELSPGTANFDLGPTEMPTFSPQIPQKQLQQRPQGKPQPMQQPQQQQQQSAGTPRQQYPTNLSLSGRVVERNEFREAADFILRCKNGNEAASLDFLRGVFLVMTAVNPSDVVSTENHDWDSAVKNGPPYLTPEDQAAAQAQLVMNQNNSILLQAQRLGVTARPPPIVPITLLGDEIDSRLSTLVILVPGRAHIVGHLIGKGGAEVGRIEREMSVTIKIEAASKLGVQLVERSVCIIGSVAATTLAQQMVSHKVQEKLLSEGVQAEVLKMIVPNEIVRHLIGKSGANINRLQTESGARIQVEPESTMSSGSVGRTIVLQGAERCRTFAQYLILRQIAEDRNVHSEWAGRLHSANGPASPTATPMATPPSPTAPSLQGSGVHQLPSHASPLPPYGATPKPQQGTLPLQQMPGGSDEEMSVFTVPEQAVAFLIGRNGASVMEIQNQTGARVHIARMVGNGGGPVDENRRVTVSGSARSVEAAQTMIRQKVHLALSGAAGGQSPSHLHHSQHNNHVTTQQLGHQ